jgi:hypothetical protein
MTTRIQTQAELLALTSRRARRGVFRVELNVPGYSRDVRRLQHHLNRCLRTRGWAMASLFLLAGAAALAGCVMFSPGLQGDGGPRQLAAAVTALLVLGVSGKLAGLWWVERRLRRALTEYRV